MRQRQTEYIECAGCGARVEKKHYAQRFCSGVCRNRWHNDERAELIELARKIKRGEVVR